MPDVFSARTVIILSPQPWSHLSISKHHYAMELAKKNTVFFICPPRHRLASKSTIKQVNDGLFVIDYSVNVPELFKFKWSNFYHAAVRKALGRVAAKYFKHADYSFDFGCYQLFPSNDFLPSSFRIFFPVDDSPLITGDLRGCRIAFTVSKEIQLKFHEGYCHFINHGLSDIFVTQAKQEIENRQGWVPSGKVKVGYAGNLFLRFIDFEMFERLIKENPEVEFHFFGDHEIPVGDSMALRWKSFLTSSHNCVFHGWVSSGDLVNLYRGMDLFLLCYKPDHVNYHGENSHKILEYLSTGKVVVSSVITIYKGTGLLEMPEMGNDELTKIFKHVVNDIAAFNSVERAEFRRRFALENSYKNQLERIASLVKKQKIRVALVVSHPIQHFCPQYASFANNAGIELHVFFGSRLGLNKYYDPQFKKEIAWDNLGLDRFPHTFLNGEVVLPSGASLDAPSLDSQLAAFQPDVVIVYGYFQKLSRRAHKWAKKNGVSLGYISDSERRHRRNKLTEFAKYLPVRKYFSGIHYFLSVGDANEAFYQSYGVPAYKIVRMHFPIDVLQYEGAFRLKEVSRREIRTKYEIGFEAMVVLVVGKLVVWKNQDHIIEAMRVLEAEGVYCHLLVAGSGGEMEKWQEKALLLQKSKVHFVGFVSPVDLPAYYAAADIYVHPAAKEPHSIAISEAIYMGCPIIVSDLNGSYGPSDDVQIDVNGFVYRWGDIADLAERIKALATDAEKRINFSKRSHELGVRFQYSAHEGIMAKIVNKYNAVSTESA
jgi:glycosyltransferase involved in cell wall biosynthesis